jgi:hypothetical protein
VKVFSGPTTVMVSFKDHATGRKHPGRPLKAMNQSQETCLFAINTR